MRLVLLPLLPLLLAALTASPAIAAECQPVERAAESPVHVILYGYPHGAPPGSPLSAYGRGLPFLDMVDDDIRRMARFFEALGPVRVHAHGEPTPALLAQFWPNGLRPPTWSSLLESVAEVAADLDRAPDAAGEPQVYIYLAGHGVRLPETIYGPTGRLAFFARPDGRAPGYDGVIDSALFAEHILTPLAARARVHLIADTCFSYHLLQTRRMALRRRVVKAPLREVYDKAFGEAFPDVGALLAARAGTLEDSRRAGRFSHTLRSLAIGPADADGDGVLTYGEMADALGVAAEADWYMSPPEVMPPGGDRSAPFIRWTHSPAARVCLPGDIPGARHLYDGPELHATLALPPAPSTLWLVPGRKYTLLPEWIGIELPFTAAEGPLRVEGR